MLLSIALKPSNVNSSGSFFIDRPLYENGASPELYNVPRRLNTLRFAYYKHIVTCFLLLSINISSVRYLLIISPWHRQINKRMLFQSFREISRIRRSIGNGLRLSKWVNHEKPPVEIVDARRSAENLFSKQLFLRRERRSGSLLENSWSFFPSEEGKRPEGGERETEVG